MLWLGFSALQPLPVAPTSVAYDLQVARNGGHAVVQAHFQVAAVAFLNSKRDTGRVTSSRCGWSNGLAGGKRGDPAQNTGPRGVIAFDRWRAVTIGGSNGRVCIPRDTWTAQGDRTRWSASGQFRPARPVVPFFAQ
jgi:hypothetical protein